MMTRGEIEQQYRVVADRIVSRGKFEGEPVYAPAYWEQSLEGAYDEMIPADDEMAATYVFNVDASDVTTWPMLEGVKTLRIWEDDFGFVHMRAERAA